MATIKVTPKTRNVKLKYPNREQRSRGETHRVESYRNVTVSYLEPSEHVVVLNSGELDRALKSLAVSQHALEVLGAPGQWMVQEYINLRTKLASVRPSVEAATRSAA